METLKTLRSKAKEQGLYGYSTMNKEQLQQLLRGEKVVKYRKNQSHAETQTEDFPKCHDCQEILGCHTCGLNHMIDQLSMQRNIVHDGDMEIDVDTGEVLGPIVKTGRLFF